jgi:hypothetical protein
MRRGTRIMFTARRILTIEKGRTIMKQIKTCEHCGGRVVQYVHSMSLLLAETLEKFAIESGLKPCLLRNVSLSHSQRCNFTKLDHFGLVRKAGDCKWEVTDYGNGFLRGRMAVSQKVITFRGQKVAFEGAGKLFKDLTGREWQGREQYAREARPIEQPAAEGQLALV